MNEGITDPSDWPSEFNSLKEIESHLRCPICKEILRAPLILQCSHNFCSECIRRHLDKELACPTCRKEANIIQLRRNTTLDEIANHFKDCRSTLLKTVKDSLAPKPNKPQLTRGESMDIDEFAPNQKRRRTSTRITNKPITPRQSSHDTTDTNMESTLSEEKEEDDKDDDFVLNQKGKNVARGAKGPALRTRGGGRSSDLSTLDTSNTPTQVQHTTIEQSRTITSTSSTTTTFSTQTATISGTPNSAPITHTTVNTRSLVPCPVCDMAIPESYSNTHLDKYCFQGIPDPAYNISFKLLSKVPEQRVIDLYEKQGSSKHNIMGVLPSSGTASNISNSNDRPVSPLRHNGVNGVTLSGSTNGQSPKSESPLQNRTKLLSINSLGKPPAPPSFTEPKRIPKLTYSVLNDKQLRKKLQEHGLQTHGDKQLMQKRHAEYVTIYNANCDATRPLTQAQLMKSMEIWERSYEQDMQAKRKQQQELAKRQEQVREANAANSNNRTDPASPLTGGSLSQQSSQGDSSSSSSTTFTPNHNNNTEAAATVAAASAFAHVLKYADEYAELIADVKKRMKTDKEKLSTAEKQKVEKNKK